MSEFSEKINKIAEEFDKKFHVDMLSQGCKMMKKEFGFDLSPKMYENMMEAFRLNGINPWEDSVE